MKSFRSDFSRTDSSARKVEEQSLKQEKATYSSAAAQDHLRCYSARAWLLAEASAFPPVLQGRGPGMFHSLRMHTSPGTQYVAH